MPVTVGINISFSFEHWAYEDVDQGLHEHLVNLSDNPGIDIDIRWHGGLMQRPCRRHGWGGSKNLDYESMCVQRQGRAEWRFFAVSVDSPCLQDNEDHSRRIRTCVIPNPNAQKRKRIQQQAGWKRIHLVEMT